MLQGYVTGLLDIIPNDAILVLHELQSRSARGGRVLFDGMDVMFDHANALFSIAKRAAMTGRRGGWMEIGDDDVATNASHARQR